MDGTLVNTRDAIVEILDELSIPFHFHRLDKECVKKLRNTRSINLFKVLKVPFWKVPFLARKAQKELSKRISSFEFVGGMEDVLRELKVRGYILGVVTANSEENVNLFFKDGKREHFDFIRSGVLPFFKHDAFEEVAEEQGFELKDLCYVGDETRDIVESHKNNLLIISVTWGFATREILETLAPNHIIDHPHQILEILE